MNTSPELPKGPIIVCVDGSDNAEYAAQCKYTLSCVS